MRYYKVDLTRPDGNLYQFKSLGNAFGGTTSLTSLLPTGPQNPRTGLTNRAALQVEMDLPVANFTDPDAQAAWFRVWGLGLNDLGHAADLNGLEVSVYGGMARGLPLANPNQAGLLLKGQVYAAFGNWNGTDQTLDMLFSVLGSQANDPTAPGNFPFSMPKGTTLGAAIANTLAVAYPNTPVQISVSPNLVLNYDQTGHYPSLGVFASFVEALSIGIVGDATYTGVQITSNGASIVVTDGRGPALITGPGPAPTPSTTKTVAFQDLIGQPTWVAPNTISFQCVMRADIHQGDTVVLPQTLVSQSGVTGMGGAGGTPQTSLTFSGKFQVRHVHHYGHSHQPDGASWNTTYQAVFSA